MARITPGCAPFQTIVETIEAQAAGGGKISTGSLRYQVSRGLTAAIPMESESQLQL